MAENNVDCLKFLYVALRQNIRKNTKVAKKKVKENYITEKIDSFFILNEEKNKWSFS